MTIAQSRDRLIFFLTSDRTNKIGDRTPPMSTVIAKRCESNGALGELTKALWASKKQRFRYRVWYGGGYWQGENCTDR